MTNEKLPTRNTEWQNLKQFGLRPPTSPDPPVVTYDAVGSDHDQESGLDLTRLVAAVVRFKWLVVLTTILGAVGGGVAWSLEDLEYVAGASLWIQDSNSGNPNQGPITGARILTSSSWIALLRSSAVLIPVVMDNRLYLTVPDPTLRPAFASFGVEEAFSPGAYELLYSPTAHTVTLFRDGLVVETKAPGDRLGAIVGFDWTPPVQALPADTRIAFSVAAPQLVMARIQANLGARIDNAAFIRVLLRGKDPARIAATLNEILDQHVKLAAELKSAALEERTSVLEGQLATVESELENSERQLMLFQISTIALPSDAGSPIQGRAFQTYNALKVEIESRRAGRRAMERVLAGLPDSTLKVEALEVIPYVGTSSQLVTALSELTSARAQLRSLRRRYTDEHRGVQDLTRTIQGLETGTIPDLLRSLVQRVRDVEEGLQARIDAATVELGDIPPRSIEQAGLVRRVALAERLYGELRGRYQEAALASASSVPDVRVLDRASPPTAPQVDNRVRAALILLLGGLGAGLVLAILLDRVDTRIQYATDVTNALGLDILGVIPVIDNRSARGARQALEAFRNLRVKLEFAYGAGKPLAFTLTSPDQSEGKSTMVANLAAGFGAVGRRTLVIDGDTRQGDLHRMLEVPRKPGLTDFLRGDSALAETVQVTKFSGVHLIASGSGFQASPDMLASGNLGDLLGELWRRYDVILVDSPPLGAGADALILCALTGQVGLVLRAGQSDVRYARAKLEALEHLPVRLLGVILNAFVPGRAQGHYTYADYIEGYDSADEPKAPEALLDTVER